MATSLNRWEGIGNVGADPETRYTPGGKAVATFSVACTRSWRDSAGAQHEDTTWVRCVAWEQLAEICTKWLSKGAKVYVSGRLQVRSYEDKDGVTRWTTEVVVEQVIMLDGKRGDGEADGAARGEPQTARSAQPVRRAVARRPRAAPVPDDDLPF